MVGQNIGKYRVLDRVGRGGMGTVYRAIDETLHRDVAIKVLNAELNDPEVARRFRAEAITVARLSHPGIATIYELFQNDGQWLMVMEFVQGETLERLVERSGVLAPERAAELCMQSLAALAHAHSMGVVHRDLKPANIMVTESGTVKIMDFGIARVTGTEHLTNVGFMMGTPAYMAPEQVLGHDIDARADLYAMGVVFYRLLTAQLPFKGETPFAMAQAQVNSPPTPIGTLRHDLPPWVDEIMNRSLAKKPDDRFQSAAEFHEGLARSLAGLPMPSAYSSSAPTSLMMTPPRAVPTGTIDRTNLPTGTPRPAPVTTPVGGQGNRVPVEPFEPTIAASTPAALVRPAAEPLTMSATNGLAVALPEAVVALPSAHAPGPVAGRKGGVALVGVAVGAVAVLGAVAFFALRSGPAPAVPVEPSSSTSVAALPPGDQAAAARPPEPPAPPSLPAAPAAAAEARGAAGRVSEPAAPEGGRRGDAAARGAAANGGRRGSIQADDQLLTFTDVRVQLVDGNRSRDQEVLLNFVGGQIAVVARGTAIATLPYRSIASATFVRAREYELSGAARRPGRGWHAPHLEALAHRADARRLRHPPPRRHERDAGDRSSGSPHRPFGRASHL
jgi:eukaryotic-like serine/threonine-protein kinase